MKKCRPKDERTESQRAFDRRVSLEAAALRIFDRRTKSLEKDIEENLKKKAKIVTTRLGEGRCAECGFQTHWSAISRSRFAPLDFDRLCKCPRT